MGKIIQLTDKLSNLIAAGEVVENMASVVKELVENSIDANSTTIQIDLQDAGLNEIKVTDDGEGMSPEDMKMALTRHATSKIKTEHDLFHIQSLGFRGEALPSIASVSHFEMISSFEGVGHRLFYLKGKLQEEGEYAPKQGTTITVRYLFYNTPARLKHLRATTTELSYIVDYVNKIALSHPEIKFTLTNDQRVLFRSNGNKDVLQVLSNIYNIDIIKAMVPFANENSYFSISGYLTKPLFTRSTRNHITIVANDRMIKNNKLIKAVTEGYRTYLPIGKYPIVFLKIDLDPLLIDVNVHPQKLEVKFTEERMLLSLVTSTILETLKQQSLIPKVEKKPVEQPYKYETLNLKTEEQPSLVKEDFVNYLNTLTKKKQAETPPPQPHKQLVVEETRKLPRLEYIGQFMGTYLLAQNEEGLYIVDQHAAAERIRYERYRRLFGEVETKVQELLIPMTLNLSNHEVLQLNDHLDAFTSFGITAKPNNYQGIDIYTVPNWFPENYELSYTEEIAKFILEGRDITITDVRDSLAKNLSCKHSIKANKFINEKEITILFQDLSNCENPYTCPHGRPVIIHFTVSEIEKLFKRIQS
ncbi:DNA mismatch repair endonuclease MutL [Candidatus Xianfuyuplasma coldseepsis]|uniref:DNA mismatch repair protein MutL n=1 Tax=Candidatus Xianfuyuplasma coldseepsis TaxID=2782163 RepID=A0A7L7KTL5_9MOLU|nr:DNA mismatch repair endonuclease MutL [Xianfuyuplasma coldseepsis]QMS85652.1 DNA mismatch repair endonuclease MutL [Xianfuyuplasma coldseepsis]